MSSLSLFKLVLGWLLFIMAVEDIKRMRVDIWYLILFGVLAVLGGFLHLSYLEVAGGFGVCLVWLVLLYGVVYIFTRKKQPLGEGDIFVLLSLGIFMGTEKFIYFMMALAFICLIFLIIFVISGLKDRLEEIPFIPFILIGFILSELVWRVLLWVGVFGV